MGIYEEFGVRPVINGAGNLTRLGGSLMDPEVLAAMAEASRSFVRIEELQEQAGRYLAEVTGAEAGYVTCGAAAGLTMAIAACVAGLDPLRMEQLPDTRGLRNQVVVQRAHRNAYDHAVRAAGVELVEIGWAGHRGVGLNLAWQLESVLSERTAAVFYLVANAPGALSLPEVVAVAHRRQVPVVVDAAAALPPPENLRRFIAEGADLVVFSGGKAIRGPQASGILAGRRRLIESVALQHQDMDVHPQTWSLRRRYLDTGILPGPPHQGLGRGFKAGKEEIIGLLVALQRFLRQDFGALHREWQARCEQMAARLDGLPGVRVEIYAGETKDGGAPEVHLRIGPEARLTPVDLVNHLAGGDPPICLSEAHLDQGVVGILPTTVSPQQDSVIVAALRSALE